MALPLPTNPPAPKFKLQPPAAYFPDAATQALLAAVLAGDLAAAKQAVARGASPDAEGPPDNPYNRLRLLHYAIAADSAVGVRTLMAVGANPELSVEGGAGRPLLFAETLDKPELLGLMLDLKPVAALEPSSRKLILFEAVVGNRPRCLQVVLAHGVPIDTPDGSGGTLLREAMDVQNYELAKWLVEQGASVLTDAHDLSMAWTIQFHLGKWKPGTAPWQQVHEIQEMAIARGAVFPAKSPKDRRAERAASQDK